MATQIIKAAFKKVTSETDKESTHGISEFLSEYILENFKYSISTKSLTRYYKGETSPNLEVRNYLAQYLGYENYESFVAWNTSNPIEDEVKSTSKNDFFNRYKMKLVTFSILILVIATSGYIGFSSSKEECMKWEGDHYEKTNCTGSIGEEEFVPYLYDNFKKIPISDGTTFFKNGEVQVWYDKSNNELEFFTAPGIHPTNGKTLKPITKYIIEKYIQ